VWIPKPDGKQRPLGIPTVKDRVVQMAAVLVLEPIFEADLPPEQFAYRPGRSALDAVKSIHALINHGYTQVVDADLSGYFDSIPHAELMKSLARRISDKHVLHLIKMWLEAAVEEIDDRGHTCRTTRSKDEHRGTPQGAPISPLLSNIYMRRFVLGWKQANMRYRLDAYVINYADDLVICCRGSVQRAAACMRDLMQRLKLTVNEAKTRIACLPRDTFDFLGYTFGRNYAFGSGKAYLAMRPSQKSVQRIGEKIREATSRRWLQADVGDRVQALNRIMQGWANYFCLGPVSKAYAKVDYRALRRMRQWLRRKHQQSGSGYSQYPVSYLYDTLGLTKVQKQRRIISWALT
jgi:group II intron reverse transcriptase/maturase